MTSIGALNPVISSSSVQQNPFFFFPSSKQLQVKRGHLDLLSVLTSRGPCPPLHADMVFEGPVGGCGLHLQAPALAGRCLM